MLFQIIQQLFIRGFGRVKNRAFIRGRFDRGEKGDVIFHPADRGQRTRPVGGKIARFDKLVQRPEHGAVVHMVSVQQRVAVREFAVTAAVEEDAARERIVAVRILVQIVRIGFALHNRVIDVGIVDGQPRCGVIGELPQDGDVFFSLRLILQDALIARAVIDIHRVDHGVDTDKENKERYNKDNTIDTFVDNSDRFAHHRISPFFIVLCFPGRAGRSSSEARDYFPDFCIGRIRAVMPTVRRSGVFVGLRIVIIILSMVLSIVISSALCDEEDDQRAEQQSTDRERSDGQQNACRDDTATGVGKGNRVVAVRQRDVAGVVAGDGLAVVDYVGRGVVLSILADGADSVLVQVEDLDRAAVCQVDVAGVGSVAADRDGAEGGADAGRLNGIGAGDGVGDVEREGEQLVLIALVTGDRLAELKVILGDGVGIAGALDVGVGCVGAVGADRGRRVAQNIAVYGEHVGRGVSHDKDVEIARGGVIGDAGLAAVGLGDHISVDAGLGEGVRREGHGNALLGILLARCGRALRVCRQTVDGVGGVGVGEGRVADRRCYLAGEDLDRVGGRRYGSASGDGVAEGDVGDVRVGLNDKVLGDRGRTADRGVGGGSGRGDDGKGHDQRGNHEDRHDS